MDYIENIEEIMNRQLAELPPRDRLYSKCLDWQGRAILLLGARGVGKSTILLRQAKDHNLLYFSCDNPLMAHIELWKLAEAAMAAGYSGLALDEVHFANQWSQTLKAIYDAFPKLKIWVSDSVSLGFSKEVGDLSRRFLRRYLPILSLREYIHLKCGEELPVLSCFSLDSENVEAYLEYGEQLFRLYRDYVSSGTRPFFLEGAFGERLRAAVEKAIVYDIPFYVPEIDQNSIRTMQAIVGTICRSDIPTVNIETLCRNWGLSKKKIYQLLAALDQLQIINIVRKRSDRSIQGKGAKIFFNDPAVYAAFGGNLGNTREAMVVAMFQNISASIFASSKEHEGDYLIDDVLVEVGGRSKKAKKSDVVVRDDIERPHKNAIPLWVVACQY